MIPIRKNIVVLTITLTRLMLAAWVGGAILFVMTSIAEQRSPAFNSIVRDQLATIRFPMYYCFGTVCLATAMIASGLGGLLESGRLRRRLLLSFLLTAVSSGIMSVDYALVYTPLQRHIVPPGSTKPQDFITLHQRSRLINGVHLGFALLAAIVICIPVNHPPIDGEVVG